MLHFRIDDSIRHRIQTIAIELAANHGKKNITVKFGTHNNFRTDWKLECSLAGKEQEQLLADHYKSTKYQNITRELSIVLLATFQGYNSNNTLTLSPSAGIFATCLFSKGYKLY